MKVKGAGELLLLERIKPYLDAQAGGDDAAVIADGGGFTVATCDMFVEGVHFDLAWMTPEDAGWRSLALTLGDLAAKGATPAWALISVALPGDWTVQRLTGLYEGMAEIAPRLGLSLVGGDMSATDGPAVISITATGRTNKRPLMRADAKPGWAVGVTGALGAAAVALRGRRPHRLVPLFDEGRRLNELGLCCGDISDGLVREMEKFAAMSGAGCRLRAKDVPAAPDASTADALTSGEEAELVCVGPHDAVEKAGLRVVGELTTDRSVEVVGLQLESTGYDHFGR